MSLPLSRTRMADLLLRCKGAKRPLQPPRCCERLAAPALRGTVHVSEDAPVIFATPCRNGSRPPAVYSPRAGNTEFSPMANQQPPQERNRDNNNRQRQAQPGRRNEDMERSDRERQNRERDKNRDEERPQ
ncbi:MAG TPA: hypothetical protein VEA80_00240 [Vitreimonas sp.]|uniref:hypothetical protein n=1 Tax=Vitreimonas sp. TaxID=3069702 RepID=UPI002D353969|nr:hypothetical protein [Vitreimonas sp.]HYD85882.1 hypothetical protein [Vitreimonas sp.]